MPAVQTIRKSIRTKIAAVAAAMLVIKESFQQSKRRNCEKALVLACLAEELSIMMTIVTR